MNIPERTPPEDEGTVTRADRVESRIDGVR
jgi:hypothetical protein